MWGSTCNPWSQTRFVHISKNDFLTKGLLSFKVAGRDLLLEHPLTELFCSTPTKKYRFYFLLLVLTSFTIGTQEDSRSFNQNLRSKSSNIKYHES